MSDPPKLSLVPDSVYWLDRPPETTSGRVRRHQFEAQILAREHIGELRLAMKEVEGLAFVVAQGGDIYPPGVRDAAGRLLSYLQVQAQTLDTLVTRLPEPRP
jgi:hypothetical protein